MPWLLVDLLLVLLALTALVVVALPLWRSVKQLGRSVESAGDAVGAAGDRLARAQQSPRLEQGPGATVTTVTAPELRRDGARPAGRQARG